MACPEFSSKTRSCFVQKYPRTNLQTCREGAWDKCNFENDDRDNQDYLKLTVVLDYSEAILLYNIIITDEGGPIRVGGPLGGVRKLMTKTKPAEI